MHSLLRPRSRQDALSTLDSNASSASQFSDNQRASVLFIASSTNIQRVHRMATSIAKKGLATTVLEWDRDASLPDVGQKPFAQFRRLRLHATSGIRVLVKYPLWISYTLVFSLTRRFSVIQAQNLDNLIVPLLLRRALHVRIVYDLADFYADGYIPRTIGTSPGGLVKRAVAWLERLLLRKADGIILSSELQEYQTGRLGLPSSRTVIWNSPSTEELRLTDALSSSRSQTKNVRLYYGGVLGGNNATCLLNLSAALEGLDGISLTVAGWGEMAEYMKRTLERTKNSQFLGHLSYAEALRETARCDCMVLAYPSDHPNVKVVLACKFLEAMALGKSQLAPRNTEMGRIVQENRIGFLTDYKDPVLLRRSLLLLKDSQDMLPSMGARARELFYQEYSWETMEKRLVDLYKDIIESPKKPAQSLSNAS